MNSPRMTDPKQKNGKRSLSFVIKAEMTKQIDERLALVREISNVYLFMSSIPDSYLHEDDEAIYITLKQPMFNDEPSIFDFRKPCLKELVTIAKRLFPLNCTYTEEYSMTITKISTKCTEQYDRTTYLSNGSRQEPTTPYVNYNKSARTKSKSSNITIELELD